MMDRKRKHFHGYHETWYAEVVSAIADNAIKFPDMIWRVKDNLVWDTRHVYALQSTVFDVLFTSCSKNESSDDVDAASGLPIFPATGYLENPDIFRMIRIFCHTGTLEVYDGDSVETLLDYYFASDFYGLEGALKLLHTMLVDQLSPGNVLRVYELLLKKGSSEGTVIEKEVEDYIATYAFVVLKHKSMVAFPTDLLGHVAAIATRDDLNIPERDLLFLLYNCCKMRTQDPASAMDMMMEKWEGGHSLWGSIRVSGLSQRDFTDFIFENGTAFDDSDSLAIIKFLHVVHETNAMLEMWRSARREPSVVIREMCTSAEPRATFRPISLYPRNLHLYDTRSPQSQVVYWASQKIIAYVALQYDTKSAVALDPIRFCKSIFHLQLTHSDNSINVLGRAHVDKTAVFQTGDPCITAKIVTKVVNFRHDRWNKKDAVVVVGDSNVSEFSLKKLLTWHTVERSKKEEADTGYLFDIGYYPNYRVGTWMMLAVSIEKIE